MLVCRFCHAHEDEEIDFYQCEECESFMCHMCTETNIRTGSDYCEFCKDNLKYGGKWK